VYILNKVKNNTTMNIHDETTEKILEKALELHDEGESTSYILEQFPDFKSEILSMLGTADILNKEFKKESNAVVVSENSFRKLLEKISVLDRPSYEVSHEIGRKTAQGFWVSNFMSNTLWKIAVPVAVLLFVVFVGAKRFYSSVPVLSPVSQTTNPEDASQMQLQTEPSNFAVTQQSQPQARKTASTQKTTQPQTAMLATAPRTPPPATASVDDALNAFIEEARVESSLVTETNASTGVVAASDPSAVDFTKTYEGI
jgi:hypothetical protein